MKSDEISPRPDHNDPGKAAPAETVYDYPEGEQFRLLVDSVTEYAIFMLDPAGYIVTWNAGAERLKGYSESEIVGKHFSLFYTPEDIQRGHPAEELAAAVSEGRYEEEGWRIRKDGSRFWANVVITPIRAADGRLLGYGKVTRDFTERHAAIETLRRSEVKFRLLVQSVRDYAIFIMTPQGVIASWNDGAQRIKGYTAEEIVGKHFSTFYTPEDLARNHPANELAIAAKEGRYEEEGLRVRKDGSRFYANVVITALYDDSGNLYGFAKVTRDITQRKEAEEIRLQIMRDRISRSFLRDILFSVTEGRLRFCENAEELPQKLSCPVPAARFDRKGLTDIRVRLTAMASALGFTPERTGDLVTAVSEAAMNAVVHATRATYQICESPATVQVWIADNGSGIELSTLHRATLERGFSTENSLGHGFWLMLQTCDRLWLRSTSSGTTVVVEKDVKPKEPVWLSRPKDLPMADPGGVEELVQ